MSNAQLFVGTWSLTSYESLLADGSIEYPFGADACGMLIYTSDGCMNGQVMRRNRQALEPGYRNQGASGAVMSAFDGYIAYCGTFRVDTEAGEIVHQVEASLFPNWVDSEQRRGFTFDGDRLILTAALHRQGQPAVNRLVWRRRQAGAT